MTRWRPGSKRNCLSLGFVICLCLSALELRAETSSGTERFLLGESGVVPGWLVTAQYRDARDGPSAASIAPPPSQTAVLRVDKDGWLGLEPVFKPHASGVNIVTAAARLSLARPLKGWLLLQLPGSLVVNVDSKPVLRQQTPLAHARGWQAVTLEVSAGVHTIEVTSRFQRESWGMLARLLDESGRSPAGAQWWIPFRAAAAKNIADPFEVTLDLVTSPPAGISLSIGASTGARLIEGAPVAVSISSTRSGFSRRLNTGRWPNDNGPVESQRLYLGTLGELLQLVTTDDVWSVDVGIGARHVTRTLHLSKSALLAWQRAGDVLGKSSASTDDTLDIRRASLQSAQRALSLAITDNRGLNEIDKLAERVTYLSEALARQTTAWTMPGIHQLAWRSSADSSIQKFALQVPAGVADGRPRPLIVVLHGYNGSGARALEAFLDTSPGATAPKVDGYVLAPDAHGNAFYRGAGERDVLEILDWAMQALAVDKTRISITGASMGGTGTAEIAFHYPDRFASLAPLCGYQSYYVRRDTALQPIRQWERRLMHRFSPASSAEAGRYLPMYLAQGLKDKPLENSRVLTNKYKQLGYSLVEDWPDLGHAVWKRTWAHAGLFPWLAQKQREEDPVRITLSVTALRHGQSHWLHLTELASEAEIARIDAKWESPDRLLVSTKGVNGFEIGPTSRMGLARPLEVQVDGTRLSLAPHPPIRLRYAGGQWTQGAAPTSLRKAVHAEGPWVDLWNEKLAFVYGTLDAATAGTNRSVAEALATLQGGVEYRYPVLSDQQYDNRDDGDRVPVLVGTSADHRLLARWGRKLPIVVDGGAVVLGNRRYRTERVGAVFVYPNPDNPRALVGVVTAPTAEGLWESTLLPALIPDFMVFDTRVAAAAGQPILGRAGKVPAAGFFNADWSLPERTTDPLDEN